MENRPMEKEEIPMIPENTHLPTEDVAHVSTTLETPPVAAKQYLLMVDEFAMGLLMRLVPGLLFVETQGFTSPGHEHFNFLVNPRPVNPQPLSVATPSETPKQE